MLVVSDVPSCSTWEWQPSAQIRGYAHPMLFAIVYKFLQLCGLDTGWAVAWAPRLLQGCIYAVCDFYVYKLSLLWFNGSHTTAMFSFICQLLNWFNFFCGVRTFSNSIETPLTVALHYISICHLQSAAASYPLSLNTLVTGTSTKGGCRTTYPTRITH